MAGASRDLGTHKESAALYHPLPSRGSSFKKRAFDLLQGAIFRAAWDWNLIQTSETKEEVIDSTGLETRHVSLYYRWKKRQFRPKSYKQRMWPKLTIAAHAQTHLIAGVDVILGPAHDAYRLGRVVREAARYIHFNRVLADAGFDSEKNHVICRCELGIRTTAIPVYQHFGNRCWPKTKFRRLMKTQFPKQVYKNRCQVESVFSRFKRLLGAALRARHWPAQRRECHLRVLTLNLMILAPAQP